MVGVNAIWKDVVANSFCDSVRDGTHDSPKYVEDGHFLITSKNIRNGQVILETANLISEQDFADINRRSKVDQWDVLFSMIGTVGEVCLVRAEEPPFAIKNIGLFKVGDELKAKWLYYWLCSPMTQAAIRQACRGSSQQYIPLRELRNLPVRIPTKPGDMRKIVDILSAYDDLIENNRRRIALLEEAARLLYREWFVHFRFPGHEHVKIIDGLPEGWEHSVPSGVIAKHIGGGWGKDQPQGKEGEPAFVIRGTDIPRVESGDISSVGLRFHSATSLRSRVLMPYDVVFEVSGGSSSQPIARTLLLTEERLKLWNADVICASFCKRFTFSTAADALYFIFHIREYRDRGDVLVYQKESASSLKNFNFESFMSSYEFLLPPIFLRKLFFESIDPIVSHQSVLATQIQKLIQARDLLLPRLMNGEIAV